MTRLEVGSNGSHEEPAAHADSYNKIGSQKVLDVQVPVIGIIGGPGSGKGTQCEKLVQKYGFTHISTGDLMRDEVKRGTEVGLFAAKCMKEGRLVDSSVVLNVLRAKIERELPTSPGFILDGYPRSLEQAEAFEQICPITAYVYLHVSDEVMLQRLVKRGKKSGRADDNEETARNRIAVFHRETQPIITNYSEKLMTVPAEGTVEQVQAQVDHAFSSILFYGSRHIV